MKPVARILAATGGSALHILCALEVDADLIVVGKHGSHIAEELLLGSVTKHVLAEAQGDVLVIADARQSSSEFM